MQEIELRQAALAVARLEAGQRMWLARQQRAWRRGALLHEQVLLLALAGANLELYDAASWRQIAHEVAAYLMGCQIEPVGLPLIRTRHCLHPDQHSWCLTLWPDITLMRGDLTAIVNCSTIGE